MLTVAPVLSRSTPDRGGRPSRQSCAVGRCVSTHNAPGAELGPGQVATWATATDDEVEAFGFKWSWPGRSSYHFPFDWSGPAEA